MTILNAFLSKSRVRKVLATKPGEEGFSLIELVVVVAVLAVLSAIAIPNFQSMTQKARAAAASNTVATMAKECATKLADAGAGTVVVPRLQGYDVTVVGTAGFKFKTAVTTGTKADGGTNVNPGLPYTCSEANTFGFVSEDPNIYPSFSYNTSLGEKKCSATSGVSQGRGCKDGVNW